MKPATQHHIRIADQAIDYLVVRSKGARRLRVRIGLDGVEVVQPVGRDDKEASEFLVQNGRWIIEQLERVDGLSQLRRTVRRPIGEIMFRGVPTPVRIEATASQAAGNAVRLARSEIVVARGSGSRTPVARSLELWLRREARSAIQSYLQVVCPRVGQFPARVYVMNQRTKWGNCSSRGNLSFNWRLILAPDFVLRYIATHEAVHLVVQDHSARFWLTVLSLCGDAEKARRWLSRHEAQLLLHLSEGLAWAGD